MFIYYFACFFCLFSSFVFCLNIFGAGIVDGGSLRKIPSEPKTAPVILGTLNQGGGLGAPLPSQGQARGLQKLHIDIPSIDDSPGV